ncbi:MAG TPA: hypothetical protein VKR24_03965 [Candidatus Limnocylindrales bacterium]|nr:hypothetical protein [Candidatus Limnocylindrales bacterium]
MPAFAHLQPNHDETLIARLAADDLTGADATDAARLVAECPACAELHADLRSIIAATAELPAPRRTRDFRLTEGDAARLRGSGWRRVLGRFGDPRLAFTRPLATGLVTLGIAGLVLAAAPSFLPTLGASSAATAAPAVAPAAGGAETTGSAGGGAIQGDGTTSYGAESGSNSGPGLNPVPSAPVLAAASPVAPEPSGPAPTAAASAAPSVAASAGTGQLPPPAASAPEPGGAGVGALPSTPILADNPGVGKSTDASAPAPSGPSPLVLASIALLVLGLVLAALSWVARRTT